MDSDFMHLSILNHLSFPDFNLFFPYHFQIKETKLVVNPKLVPSVKEPVNTDLGNLFLLELIVILCMTKDCLGKADQTK